MNASHIPLSACIIAKNEADRIGACIQSVKDIADEVVVVDSGSTDDTLAVAQALGAKTFHRDWTGYGPQKRFSEECASHDWILNLDADEVVSPALAAEIRALLRSEPPLRAYRLKLRTVYPNRSRPRLWADFHNYVRLYDRRAVRFRDSAVHDTVDVRSERVGQLHGSAAHFSARSFQHMKDKLESYSGLQAKVMKKTPANMFLRLPFEYPLVFLRYFLVRRHFTGGWDGVRAAHIAARARFRRLLKFLRAHEARKQESQPHG
ncbi:MAG: glycosyltransferase family 2 protein [Caulobacterales bacterium]